MTQSEKLARAEDTVRLLAEDYPNWALEDLAKLDALFTRIEAESTDDDGNDGGGPVKTSLRAAYRVSHDMRGQGGSFGYPLMTRIATSLCRFIDALEIPNETARAILVAHARAMRAILENRISGEGGTLGSQIAEGLEQAAARHATSNADGG